jgi:hypothetical protein
MLKTGKQRACYTFLRAFLLLPSSLGVEQCGGTKWESGVSHISWQGDGGVLLSIDTFAWPCFLRTVNGVLRANDKNLKFMTFLSNRD